MQPHGDVVYRRKLHILFVILYKEMKRKKRTYILRGTVLAPAVQQQQNALAVEYIVRLEGREREETYLISSSS